MTNPSYTAGYVAALQRFKVAFDEQDMANVFNRSKAKRVPRQLAHRAGLEFAPGATALAYTDSPRKVMPIKSDLQSVLPGTPAKDIHQQVLPQIRAQMQQLHEAAPLLKQVPRTVKRTPALLLSGDSGAGLRHFAETTGREMPKMNGPQRKALNALVHAHELDEASVIAKGNKRIAFGQFGHMSPDVILREHNRIVTLPEHLKPAGQALATVRKPLPGSLAPSALREQDMLKGLVDIGQGARLSRHARKHITNLVHQRFLKSL
jgi:hypothetical protein